MKALAICSFKQLPRWNWKSNFSKTKWPTKRPESFGWSLGCCFLLLLASTVGSPKSFAAEVPAFRLHLSKEPTSLDTVTQKNSSASWLLGNLHRNLLSYDNDKGLLPDLGEGCKKISKWTLECKLKKNLQWSDGSELTSQNFLNTYKRLLDPRQKAPRADLLFPIKNAENIYKGESKKLGIRAPDKWTLHFDLNQPQSEFVYNLSSLQLSPTKEKGEAFSGPYKIKSWLKGSKIILEANKFYPLGNKERPAVELLFIVDDSVALRLYEKGELSLLRRVPTLYIPTFKKRRDFHFIPVTRFDYFGFGPELKNKPVLRKALALGLNYSELQKIFSSPGTPGCSGLPDEWFESRPPCLTYDQKLAKELVAKLSVEDRKKTYNLLFSNLGLEDHKRATEWMQAQWAQIGLKINPAPREHKIYLDELRNNTPAIFREGVTPDHPSCLSALENFTLRSSQEYLGFKSVDFAAIVEKLRNTDKTLQKKRLCTEGVRYLLEHYILIPTGAYDISMLIDPRFAGWRFNRAGQLDLGGLSFTP